jgi:hypothetical protein
MPSTFVRLVIVVVLVVHGIGHTLGLFPAFGWTQAAGWSDQSWLLTNLAGATITRWIGVAIWLAATIGFVVVGLAFPSLPTWWRALTIVSALVSLVGIALYPSAFPSLVNKVGAIAVDGILLVALLWLNLPTARLAGA